jgi:UDP-N-acetylmuramate-alanine ligase
MFAKIQRIHFVGIGGIGMSGIAEVLAQSRLQSFRLGFEGAPR